MHPRALRPLALLAALAACSADAPPELRVGFLRVVAGPMGPSSGIPAGDGAALAVDELNARGGVSIGGVRHRVVAFDRTIEHRADAAAAGARALINLDSVDLIVGPQTSLQAIAAGAVAEEARVPLIATMASNPAVTAGRAFVTRLAFLDDYQGALLARFVFDSLRLRRAAALHDAASPYGRDIVALFARTFTALGGRMVGVETFDVDAPSDFRAPLRRLLAGSPEAILLPNYVTHDTVQMRQARALGFRGTFLGSDSWDPVLMPRFLEAHGAVVVANWDNRTGRPQAEAFIRAYRARFGQEPRTTAAATYDAVLLAADAATRAGSRDGRAIAAAIRSTGEWDGVMARYTFAGTGDPVRGGVIVEITPGGRRLRHADLRAP